MRGLAVPSQSEDFSADPVELFFDLAFVFAFSQLVAVLVHDPTWDGVGEAALIFSMLWMPWAQLTWAANAVPGNARNVRIVILVATAASVPMAAAVTTALDDGGLLFVIPLTIIMLMGIGLLVIALEDEPDGAAAYRSTAVAYALPIVASGAVFIAGALVDGTARVVLWLAGIGCFLWATWRAGSGRWILRAGHFSERHGLIIIVALGEVIVAIGTPLVDSLEDGAGIPAESVIALTGAGVLAGLLWWSYFDRPQRALEHRLDETPDDERAHLARDVYSYAHLPIVAGVIAIAAALEEITLHPGDELPAAFRWMMIGGFALFFGGIDLAVQRAFGVVAVERIVGAVVVVALFALGGSLDGVVLLISLDVVLLAVLAAEHLRIEGRPARRQRVEHADAT